MGSRCLGWLRRISHLGVANLSSVTEFRHQGAVTTCGTSSFRWVLASGASCRRTLQKKDLGTRDSRAISKWLPLGWGCGLLRRKNSQWAQGLVCNESVPSLLKIITFRIQKVSLRLWTAVLERESRSLRRKDMNFNSPQDLFSPHMDVTWTCFLYSYFIWLELDHQLQKAQNKWEEMRTALVSRLLHKEDESFGTLW